MEEYYQRRPGRLSPKVEDEEERKENSNISEYDQYRRTLVNKDDDEGWNSEYRRYLKDRPANVKKDTDIVRWWQVCLFYSVYGFVVILIKGTCPTLPNPCTNCPRHSPLPSILSPLRTTLLSQQANGRRSSSIPWYEKI
jgi:hypothetical protein